MFQTFSSKNALGWHVSKARTILEAAGHVGGGGGGARLARFHGSTVILKIQVSEKGGPFETRGA